MAFCVLSTSCSLSFSKHRFRGKNREFLRLVVRQPRQTADVSTNRRQSFLCCHTTCMEHADTTDLCALLRSQRSINSFRRKLKTFSSEVCIRTPGNMLITVHVSRRREMYSCHARPYVCMSFAAFPHYCTDVTKIKADLGGHATPLPP